MAARTVRIWPDPILKLLAEPVDMDNDDILELVKDMSDTMRVQFGAGLAAPQVGISKQLFVVDCKSVGAINPHPCPILEDPDLLVMINPTLELSSCGRRWNEACLSAPDFSARVRRAETCIAIFNDVSGNLNTIGLDWPLSGVVQHEYDHLIGKMYFEKAVDRRAGARIKRTLFNANRDIALSGKKKFKKKVRKRY